MGQLSWHTFQQQPASKQQQKPSAKQIRDVAGTGSGQHPRRLAVGVTGRSVQLLGFGSGDPGNAAWGFGSPLRFWGTRQKRTEHSGMTVFNFGQFWAFWAGSWAPVFHLWSLDNVSSRLTVPVTTTILYHRLPTQCFCTSFLPHETKPVHVRIPSTLTVSRNPPHRALVV